jgi:exodeoxyribonuclease VII small subunit
MGDEIGFEEAFQKAEMIARQMESGTLTLEESLEAFKEAMKLLEICSKKISMVEQEIQIILNAKGETMSVSELESLNSHEGEGKEE